MACCSIHNDVEVPVEVLEIHHKHPQAYGGGDETENKVPLCTSCHTVVHKAALKLYAGRAGQGKDLVDRFLPSQPARQERMWKMVQTIARARQQHARSTDVPDAGVESENQSVVKMQLEVPDWLHHRLQALSSGKGLYRYVMGVLENHVLVATQKPGAPPAEMYGTGRDNREPPVPDPQPTSLSLLVPRSR